MSDMKLITILISTIFNLVLLLAVQSPQIRALIMKFNMDKDWDLSEHRDEAAKDWDEKHGR